MKKEKTVKTYQRRTRTGKVVTVKQHTAKYDAAEALKEAAKKKGAGDELEARKKKSIKVIPLPKKSDDSLSRKKGPFYFNVYNDNPAKVERDPKNRSAWNVSLGGKTQQKTFDSQQKAFAYLRRVKRANGFRKSRQAAYVGAHANIPLD